MFSIQNLKVCTNQHRNRKQIKISFGNLEDDGIYLVKDKAQYEPITAAEYALLKRIGLDNVMSGYFNFTK